MITCPLLDITALLFLFFNTYTVQMIQGDDDGSCVGANYKTTEQLGRADTITDAGRSQPG